MMVVVYLEVYVDLFLVLTCVFTYHGGYGGGSGWVWDDDDLGEVLMKPSLLVKYC